MHARTLVFQVSTCGWTKREASEKKNECERKRREGGERVNEKVRACVCALLARVFPLSLFCFELIRFTSREVGWSRGLMSAFQSAGASSNLGNSQ